MSENPLEFGMVCVVVKLTLCYVFQRVLFFGVYEAISVQTYDIYQSSVMIYFLYATCRFYLNHGEYMKTSLFISMLTITGLTACGGGSGDDNTPVDRFDGSISRTTGNTSAREIVLTLPNGSTLLRFSNTTGQASADVTSLPRGFANGNVRLREIGSDNQSRVDDLALRSYRGYQATIFVTSGFQNAMPNAESREEGMTGRLINATKSSFDMPSSGRFTYTGPAFNNRPSDDAALRYTIDFGSRRGSGDISAAGNHGRLLLAESPISYHFNLFEIDSGYGVRKGAVYDDHANRQGDYDIELAGERAEELIGLATYRDHSNNERQMLFHGTR